MAESLDQKRIFLKLERVDENSVKLEFDFKKDEENYVYIMGIASTPDVNSASFIVENRALLDAWEECKKTNKNIAVYEKHETPVGKVVACQEMSGKILVVLEIPKSGNERLLAVYNQGIYIGLSIGGWTLDGEWIDDVFHVTEFEWYEVSLTDIPSNENALLLEFAESKKQKQKPQKVENEISAQDISIMTQKIINRIRGIE